MFFSNRWESYFYNCSSCGISSFARQGLFQFSGEEKIRAQNKGGTVGKVIKLKREANLKQISLWILSGIGLVFLLWIGFDPTVPWSWRSVALVAVIVGGMQIVKTAKNP